MGGWRGGAGASVRNRHASSSSKSSPKRSASEMKDEGLLRYPRDEPVGHDGYAQDVPRLELDSTERILQREPVGEAILPGEILMGIDLEGDEPGDDSKCIFVVYGVGPMRIYTQRALSAGKGCWFFVEVTLV
jgi:hypothetical protein